MYYTPAVSSSLSPLSFLCLRCVFLHNVFVYALIFVVCPHGQYLSGIKLYITCPRALTVPLLAVVSKIAKQSYQGI